LAPVLAAAGVALLPWSPGAAILPDKQRREKHFATDTADVRRCPVKNIGAGLRNLRQNVLGERGGLNSSRLFVLPTAQIFARCANSEHRSQRREQRQRFAKNHPLSLLPLFPPVQKVFGCG
jgi:hypothetical protein